MKRIFSFTRAMSFVIVGLVVAMLMYDAYINVRNQIYYLNPVTSLYEGALFIPDTVTGEDPTVQFSRTIHVAMNTDAITEIKDATTGQVICRNSFVSHLEANQPLPAHPIKLDTYYGYMCVNGLEPGEYMVLVTIAIKREGYPDRFASIQSNIFKVRAP